jgi:hypothetical protein
MSLVCLGIQGILHVCPQSVILGSFMGASKQIWSDKHLNFTIQLTEQSSSSATFCRSLSTNSCFFSSEMEDIGTASPLAGIGGLRKSSKNDCGTSCRERQSWRTTSISLVGKVG